MKKNLFTITVGLVITINALAQLTARGATVNGTPDSDTPGNTWAVIVGISKYQNVQGLNYADKDAMAFYDYLVNKKRVDSAHVQLLINEKAIASDIYGALDWLNLSVKENDRVIFYFSGHGDVETKTIYQNGFLLANDAPLTAYMTKGTINITFLQQYLETYIAKKAKDAILIVDACRSGKLAGGSQGIQITMHSLGQNWNNQIIKVLSAQEGESSFEDKKWGGGRGVFSYYLVKGLEGLANRNADSVINTAEMAAYLPFAVSEDTGSKQNPTISGNPKTNLFTFNKTLLAIANQPDGQTSTTQLASRGRDEELDPEIKQWYDQYRAYLQKGRLIWGEKETDTTNCAKYYYLKLVHDDRAKKLLPSLKSSFLASLKRKTELKLDGYIKGEYYDRVNQEPYKELAYAKSLIDTSYILYNYINARLLFLEGGNIDARDPQAAIKLFKKITLIEPDAFYAYNKLGGAFETMYYNGPNKLGYGDSSIYYYKKAISFSPKRWQTYFELGNLYADRKNYKEAIYYKEQAIKVDSMQSGEEQPRLYDDLYLILKEANEPVKADSVLALGIQVAKKQLQKDSLNAGVLFAMGSFYKEKADYVNAAKYYNKALSIDNKYYMYEELGNLYLDNLNNYDEAIKNFKSAIQIDSTDTYTYNKLSEAYLLKKDYRNALEFSKGALKLSPKDPSNYQSVANVYLQLGEDKKAAEYFAKSVALNPASFTAYYNIACFYALKNKTKKALENLTQSLEKGWKDYDWLMSDSDLTNIKELPEFKELMKKYFPDKVK